MFAKISRCLASESVESGKKRTRLFCFPHAGASTSPYIGWADQLKEHFEVFVVTLPNKDLADSPTRESFNQQITEIVDEILPFFIETPSALFGHSAGGIIAWAVALELQSRALAPLRLFASGTGAPTSSHTDEWKLLLKSDDESIKASKDLIRSWNGTPEEIINDSEAFDVLRSRVARDLSLVEYLMNEYKENLLNAPISFFYGADDDTLNNPMKEAENWKSASRSEHQERFSSIVFPGDHFYFDSVENMPANNPISIGENKISGDSLFSVIEKELKEDKERLLQSANEIYQEKLTSTMDYPADKCLHDLFYEQVKLTPQKIALVDRGRTYTFERLDYLTDLLAKWLYNVANVRPNRVTGILMERCAEFVICYIAALKAGGGYMPLEIVYPADLLSRVLEESKPCAVLTKKMFKNRLPQSQCYLEVEDSWWELLEKLEETKNFPQNRETPTPDDLAYIVMSSGTTGTPKGICCPHRGAVHSYYWRHEKYPYLENEREAANIFFVWEVLRPILRGFPAYVIPDETIYEPFALADYLETNEITRILFTPSCCQLVLDSFQETGKLEVLKQKLRFLKYVWLCGEVVTIELSTRFTTLFPDCELLNLYSISECHDVSLADLRKIDTRISQKFAPCGKIMENVQVYIFDEEKETVPMGMAGEVYVGGPCVGIGYLNRPEQTAARFVLHPKDNSKRLYKTGDRGKLLPDGSLEILGRCDYMVKIRGYSVVLGAVEVAIASHPLLSTSVVLTQGEEGTDKRLVAYIVPKEWNKLPQTEEIRTFLKDKLPHYAIPACFVPLPQLPLHDASGKLDRKRLPSPDDAINNSPNHREIIPPASPTEEKLVSIWSTLLPGNLPAEKISMTDDFFDLGGHSLLSMRLITMINVQFNITYSLKIFLQNATLREVAKNIDTLANGKQVLEKREEIQYQDDILLEDSIYPSATRKSGYSRLRLETTRKANPSNVFLTGATGFLGAFLMAKLLSMKSVHQVYCLVRAKSKEEGAERLKSVLRSYNLFEGFVSEERFESSVVIVVGDLAKPLFGLHSDEFTRIAGIVETIIHCGAWVNLILTYDELKKANVYGTREILRLATTNCDGTTHVKPVHYISTNSVFPWVAGKLCEEIDSADVDVNALEDGYSQTKWAAEQLCMEARSRGLPVAIYRPGNLSGSSRTGVSNQSDFIFLLFQGIRILENSILPDGEVANWKFDMTPVDWAASVICNLAIQFPTYCLGDILHIQTSHEPLAATNVLSFLGERTGNSLSFAAWKKLLTQRVDDKTISETDSIILRKLVTSLDSTVGYLANSIDFGCSNLNNKIQDIAVKENKNLTCPVVDQSTINKYFNSNISLTE